MITGARRALLMSALRCDHRAEVIITVAGGRPLVRWCTHCGAQSEHRDVDTLGAWKPWTRPEWIEAVRSLTRPTSSASKPAEPGAPDSSPKKNK